jgi:crotonobetainyl-CoA:carnitine CoA-transferase CaiB-like acyl-CoA transferase
MLLAFGICAALVAREKTGRGERITSSLLDVSMALQAHQLIWFTSEPPPALEPQSLVLYRVFKTKDGFMTLGVRSDRLWERLCVVLGLESLLADERYRTWEAASRHGETLRERLELTFQSRTTEEWIAKLEPAGIPCGRVRSGRDLFTDPQVHHNGMLAELDYKEAGTARVMGVPLHFEHAPGTIRRPAPRLGEHTRQILSELDVKDEEMVDLGRRRIVRID